ncbi:Rieske Fe-S protein [Kitasatospora sp. MAP12-15]|uniref:Rieske (2Fe-2S) protein n=1 Tax=unclassified Kitasatospora TaxID=2633591 RepID=UPI00247596D2|nr:Rieske (2Fe-2S) protein [Kitasatospora sp. MAP12-44]MDH6113317.1 Rieske Fe-S protein [Kitasatospora sp. MAP12-44]
MSEAADSPATTRRTLLCGVAVLAAGGATLGVAGCSGSGSTGSGGSTDAKSTAKAEPVTVGAVADVPVGGGKVYREQKLVVTQPAAGQYKSFSAVCTHAGCTVDQVASSLIQCPCHGSRFNITDGSVADGPAPSPLPEYQVTVQNGAFVVATT